MLREEGKVPDNDDLFDVIQSIVYGGGKKR
jgi:hypothetical protein